MRKYLLHVLIITFVFIAAPVTSATGGSHITLRSSYKKLSVSQAQGMPNIMCCIGFKGDNMLKV